MKDAKSVAEAEGIPFEDRCKIAKESFLGFFATMEQLANDELSHLQKKKERAVADAEGKKDVIREHRIKSYATSSKVVSDASQKMRVLVWKHAIETVGLLCGTDATDFALKALNHERKGN